MLNKVYTELYSRFGPQGWWPIDGKYKKGRLNSVKSFQEKFEIIIGAVLTQNTSWKNVEKALDNLRGKNLISPEKILKTDSKILADLIRPSGYFNQKADRLKIVSSFLLKNKNLKNEKDNIIRKKLLDVKGIGLETADSILLYAFNKPFFVIDLYTKRIFSRLGFCEKNIEYKDLQKKFHENLPKKTNLYNEYHALIVELAKKHCTKIPSCDNCPLNKICKKNL